MGWPQGLVNEDVIETMICASGLSVCDPCVASLYSGLAADDQVGGGGVAKQNAKRLHGSPPRVDDDVQSLLNVEESHMTVTQKQAKQQRKAARKSRKRADILKQGVVLGKDLFSGVPPPTALSSAARRYASQLKPKFKKRLGSGLEMFGRASSIRQTLAPNAVSNRLGSGSISITNNPQRLTDICGPDDRRDGIRMFFDDMPGIYIGYDGTHPKLGITDDGITFLGGTLIGPEELGPRVAVIASNYGFYALRELVVTYIPSAGTSTVGNVLFCLDSTVNFAETEFTSGLTIPQTIEHEPSVMDNVWKDITISKKFTGTQVFHTSILNDLGSGMTAYQACYQYCLMASTSSWGGAGRGGQFRMSGIMDLYKMDNTETSIALKEVSMWKKYTFREWVKYRLRTAGAEKINFPEFYSRYAEKIRQREHDLLRSVESPKQIVPYQVSPPLEEKKTLDPSLALSPTCDIHFTQSSPEIVVTPVRKVRSSKVLPLNGKPPL